MFLNLILLIEAVVFLAVLAVPAFFFGGVGPLPTLAIQSLSALGFGLAFTRAALTGYPRDLFAKHRRVTLATLAFLPFVIFVFFQAFAGGALFRGGPGSAEPFATFAESQQLICYVALFIAFYGFFKTRARLRLAGMALALQIVTLIAIGYYRSLGAPFEGGKLYGTFDIGTGYSSFLNPNYFGGYLVSIQPFFYASVVYFVITRVRLISMEVELIEKVFVASAVPLVAASAFAADARGAFFWMVMGLALFLAGLFFRRPAAVVAIVVVLAAAIFATLVSQPTMALGKMSGDLAGRIQVMKESAGLWRDFPLFGSGLGTSKYLLMYYQKTLAENWSLWHPYNNVLQLLSETGVVGAALFMAPVSWFLFGAFIETKSSPSRWNRVFGLGAFVALFSYLLPAMIDNYLATPAVAVVMVFHLAVLARCANGSYRPEVPGEDARGTTTVDEDLLPRALVIALVWAALAAFGVHLWNDYRAASAYTAASKSLPKLEQAVRLRPTNAIALGELGHWHYNEASRKIAAGEPYESSIRAATQAYAEAVKNAPTWPAQWTGLAKSEILAGQYELGSRHLNFCLELNPWNRDMIIYGINVQLKLAAASKWPDEKEAFERRALYWVAVASEFPRPLRPNDCYLARNFTTQLEEADRQRVSSFVARYYRSRPESSSARSSEKPSA